MADETTQPPSSKTNADDSPLRVDMGLNRDLHARHLVFLAIGGAVGTGIFLGTGSALSKAGPGSLLIAFAFIGLVAFSVLSALGELAAAIPVTGAVSVYASRLVEPSWGFAVGWVYYVSWAATPLELTAAGLIMEFWSTRVNVGIWIAVFWVVITAVNFLPIRLFGEFEMWLSSIKMVTLVGFCIFAICVNAQRHIGFRYYADPGAFAEHLLPGIAGKLTAFWAVTVLAAFSYHGMELVAVGAGEAANPHEVIPRAVKWTYFGVVGVFVGSVFCIGINIPFNNPNLKSTATNALASPLVISAQLAGVRALPSIINAVLLTAVITAANSNIYSASRILVALADERLAPALLKRTNRFGTPYIAVACSASLGLFGFLTLSSDGHRVFEWLIAITTTAGLISWFSVNLCHLRFKRALAIQGIPPEELPYRAPLQPWFSCFGLFVNTVIILTSGFTVFIRWKTSEFFVLYASLMIFVALYLGHKLVYRTKFVKLSEVDLRMLQRNR